MKVKSLEKITLATLGGTLLLFFISLFLHSTAITYLFVAIGVAIVLVIAILAIFRKGVSEQEPAPTDPEEDEDLDE